MGDGDGKLIIISFSCPF